MWFLLADRLLSLEGCTGCHAPECSLLSPRQTQTALLRQEWQDRALAGGFPGTWVLRHWQSLPSGGSSGLQTSFQLGHMLWAAAWPAWVEVGLGTRLPASQGAPRGLCSFLAEQWSCKDCVLLLAGLFLVLFCAVGPEAGATTGVPFAHPSPVAWTLLSIRTLLISASGPASWDTALSFLGKGIENSGRQRNELSQTECLLLRKHPVQS